MNQPHQHAEFICAKANGAEIQERIAGSLNWLNMPSSDWEFSPDCEYRIKPEPKYPETRMDDNEMQEFFNHLGTSNHIQARRLFAAFVLRRAIQDGDVVLPEGK